MKNKKIKYSMLFLFLIICGLSFGMLYSSSEEIQDLGIIKNPKLSVGEITILTPGNQTYYGPMSGYFPATYGFENELDGSSGTTIGYVDAASASSNCEVRIYDEIQGHKKVLRVHDGNPAGNAGAQGNFALTQTVGSVEWWWNPSVSGSNGMAYHFHEGAKAVHAGRVLIQDGNFVDFEDNIIQSYVVGQWYHHKIEFNTVTDTYDWYIDGILQVDDGNFENPVSNIGVTEIKGGWNSIGSCYVDAVGYSWDDDYSIGDSLNDGLLLSYDNTTILNWQGYSLDGQPNKTILGDTTIPMPVNGYHRVQVFGNNSMGTIYESDVRYFAISDQEPPLPPLPPGNPYLVPIIITSIVVGIVALVGITLIVFRKRMFSGNRTRKISSEKSPSDESNALVSDRMNNCPFCGIKLQKVSKFCVNCGSSLNED